MTLNIPIESLTSSLQGIPNMLYVSIALVMAASILRKVLGFLFCGLMLFAFVCRPDLVNSAISTIAALFKQYA